MSRKLVLLAALIIALVGTLGVASKVQKVEASGTIYINADGSVDPPTANITSTDGITYAFTGDIFNDSIVVLRSNIVVDGAGYMLQGTGINYSVGIRLSMTSNVTIKNLEIREFWTGMSLDYSANNTIARNTIRDNDVGVELWGDCKNNTFCHNNFIDNTVQVDASMSYFSNNWYVLGPPSGNYWSDYEIRYPDADDLLGLWSMPYVVDANNIDWFPARGMIEELCCPSGLCFCVNTGSVVVGPECWSLRFNVTGPDGTDGFCRVTIPYELMEPPYEVTINGLPAQYYNGNVYDDGTVRCIYFEYQHSTREVIIVPEFPSFLVLPLFMTATLLAAMVHRRKYVS